MKEREFVIFHKYLEENEIPDSLIPRKHSQAQSIYSQEKVKNYHR